MINDYAVLRGTRGIAGGEPGRPRHGAFGTHRSSGADHRPEPAGSAGPAGLARVPGAEGERLRGQRDLPEGPGRPGAPGHRRRRDLQVPAGAGGQGSDRLRLRVRLLLAADRAAVACVVRRERGFDVIQACNPPDTYWAAGPAVALRGVQFVFDQHDLNPELFLSRFGAAEDARRQGCSCGAALAGADDLPDRRPGHLHQRVVPAARHRPRRRAGERRHGGAQRPGHPADAPGLPARVDPRRAPSICWSTWGSWARRTASTRSSHVMRRAGASARADRRARRAAGFR